MNNQERNTRFWDGLHEFSAQCYTCEFPETELCLGCRGNSSGEMNNYVCLTEPGVKGFPECRMCRNNNTQLCERCYTYSEYEEEL